MVGALLAVAVSLAWTPGGNPPETTSVAVTAADPVTVVAPWLESGEVLVASTVILPLGLEVEDGVAVFDYDLAGLSPALVEHEDAEHQGDVVVMPERWMLTTEAGVEVEAVTSRRDSTVRFDLPSLDDEVATISLIGWRVATVFGNRIEMPIEVGATGSLRNGIVSIETVLEQRTSTIVQLDLDETGDDWQLPIIRPRQPAWRVTGRQGGGVQLIWDGVDAPDTLVLEDAGFEMREVAGDILVVDQRDEL